MRKIIDAGYLLIIYFILFILFREIIQTHLEWLPNRLFIPHDLYNHTNAPNFVKTIVSPINPRQKWDIRINSQELREDNNIAIPKPENVYRILMVGDSFIFGGNAKTIPKVVEESLNHTYTVRLKFPAEDAPVIVKFSVSEYVFVESNISHPLASFDGEVSLLEA